MKVFRLRLDPNGRNTIPRRNADLSVRVGEPELVTTHRAWIDPDQFAAKTDMDRPSGHFCGSPRFCKHHDEFRCQIGAARYVKSVDAGSQFDELIWSHVAPPGVVESKLEKKWSPEQISRWLAVSYPAQPEMNVSHETIYLSLFIQSRGALRKDLHNALRTGRAMRRPKHQNAGTRGIIPEMVLISDRPAEVEDRAVPGHWEGDLIMGTGKSCIGTLVERTTRYTILLKLERPTALEVRTAMAKRIRRLPAELTRSVTWDRGSEMFQHREFTVATGVQIYFCDPQSPWQRGTNENTNGLLRQYFPKRTSLAGV